MKRLLLAIGLLATTVGAAASAQASSPPTSILAHGPYGTVHAVTVKPTGTMRPYRPTPGMVPSTNFQLFVQGAQVPVEQVRDADIVRFQISGPVQVQIFSKHLWAGETLLPDGRVQQKQFPKVNTWPTMTFVVPQPTKLLLTVPGVHQLFIVADPIEAAGPQPGTSGVVNAADYATPNSPDTQTTRIQAAIDATAAAGGGVLYFPPGVYRTGTLSVRSKVTLYLPDGALIQGTHDPDDYPVDPGRVETSDYGKTMSFSRLIYFDQVHDAGIEGRGVIDGDGVALRNAGRQSNLIRISQSQHITLSGVTLRDPAAWNTHILGSQYLTVSDVTILNDREDIHNTDGVDVDSSQDVLVDNPLIYSGDDALTVKATDNSDILSNPQDITFTHGLLVSHADALKLGTESSATRFSGIHFINNDVLYSNRVFGLLIRDGATYSGITFADIRAHTPLQLFDEGISLRTSTSAPGTITGVKFADVTIDDYYPPYTTKPVLSGYDADHQLSDVDFDQFSVDGRAWRDADDAVAYGAVTFGDYVSNMRFSG